MKKAYLLAAVLFLVLRAGAASAASLLVSPLPVEGAEASLDTTIGQRLYEIPHEHFSISRSIFALTGAYDSFFASLGYIERTEVRDFPGVDPNYSPGCVIAIGTRGPVWKEGPLSINLHTQGHLIYEKLHAAATYFDLKSREILLGGEFVWSPHWGGLYCGIETIPYSTIETEYAPLEGIERSGFITARVGGELRFRQLRLGADVQFIGSERLRIGIGYAF